MKTRSRLVRRGATAALALLGTAILSSPLCAQGQNQTAAVSFPPNAASWINSTPIVAEKLAGKAVVLYFFEESWPRCHDKWPEQLAVASQYQGQPVLFIAVNSGNSRAEVERYARQNRITWPIIVDSNRAFEKQCGVKTLSLSNILQARILTAEGRLVSASAMDLKKTADRALQGARWNVDPTGIPATMRQAWLGVEFGDYAAVAKAVKKGLNSRKKDVKAAAEKLNAAVEAKLQEDLAAANEALAAEKKWTAFKIYSAMAAKFKGYNVPPEAAEKTKELTGDPAVQKEMQASKSFEKAARLLSSKSPASRKRAVKNLKKLIADMPLTEAARRAETILKQLGVQ